MDFLGVGPMELIFVLIIALIIMGPKDMQKTGRTIGKWLNGFVRSDSWKILRQASNKIKYLPNELMREAGIDEMNKISRDIKSDLRKEIPTDIEDPFKSWKQSSSELKTILPPDASHESNDKIEVNKNDKLNDEKK